MSAESPRHVRSGGPLTVPSRPPSDRSIIDAVSGFINDVTLSSSSTVDPKDVIQWARFETADINEPTPEGDSENDISPLLLILGYGSGVQVWLIPPTGEAQEVLSWRQGTVRVLRILPTPQHGDCFASKRPLIALCDSASPGPTFCSLSFISIRGGEQVKSIKFKNPILDVLANKRSVVVSFSERFAVFDAATLEDRMAVTTCYPCPCPLGGSAPINPLTLGDRWLAYADKKLNQSKRSSGGCEGEGVTSYTASVLHAAKSLSKGLRGFGETVAHSLAGGRTTSQSPSPPNADMHQPGVVTVLDIEGLNEEDGQDNEEQFDPIVAHFVAHSEAIIALKFDASGMLLVTADRRGHDFHVFRINPHPCGPSLASVHHLYILHRGDTTAKVQDIAISSDSRWAAVSTLRGTTHVFALSPYGGVAGVRTHTQPRVVNRLSRFHRSAGLPIHADAAHKRTPTRDGGAHGSWFPNPRLPPYPGPCTATPLAQLRPTANLPTHTITRTSSGRQRLSSVSEDSNSAPLLSRARFGLVSSNSTVNPGGRRSPSAVAALYLMSADGSLLHLLLHPRPLSSIPKEKICDDSPIELEVEPVAQWPLQRPAAAADLLAPLPPSNPLLQPLTCRRCADICMSEEERWLSQVEIVTHAGPHRRLWMGPQFVFKTYNLTGSNSSLSEAETVEVETIAARGAARSNPVNMPAVRPLVPVLVDSGSPSSLEHSPSDSYRRKSLLAESGRAVSVCDVQLKEDLAEAMKEDHGWSREQRHEAGRRPGLELAVGPQGCVVRAVTRRTLSPPTPAVDPDAHTAPNRDEATFRPVVRASAALPPRTDLPVRPLPRTTTIPVQPLCSIPDQARCSPEPDPDPEPLTATVYIPAALTDLRPWSPLDLPDRDGHGASPDASHVCEERPRVSVDVRQTRDASCERGKACTSPTYSLPKSPRPSGDVHPTRDSVKKSPTPDGLVSDVGFRSKKSSKSKESGQIDDSASDSTEPGLKEAKPPEKIDASVMLVKNECFESVVDDGMKNVKSQCANVSLDKIIERPKKDVSKEVKQSNEAKASNKVSKDKKDKIKEVTVAKLEKQLQEIGTPINVYDREPRESLSLHKKSKWHKESTPPLKVEKSERKEQDKTTNTVKEVFPPQVKLNPPIEKDEPKPERDSNVDEIKTEEQAWDMLLNEPDRPIFTINQSLTTSDKKIEESKPKSRKNRKTKKSQDEVQAKAEEDSFVEIHAIEDKQQLSSGDLVSISTPYDNIELSSSYHTKMKKVRSSKSITPERKDPRDSKGDVYKEETESFTIKSKNHKQVDENSSDSATLYEPSPKTKSNKEPAKQKLNDAQKINNEDSEIPCFVVKESPKLKNNKSSSPYLDRRKSVEKFYETEVKDVYVIDSTKEEFPEIQITKGNKPRKKSQSTEQKGQEKEVLKEVEKPVKSWSSIAASKSVKKTLEEDVITTEIVENKNNYEDKDNIERCIDSDDDIFAAQSVSLQDKLIELCKRTDVMIAECDTPSELNFVEEHHSVIHDLPPLDMDFGLDDFKLEVMRDSLLEITDPNLTSPICKISIDSILSNIEESSNRVVESSMFNLIDLEKVPTKQEKGFSFVENDKITTHEVKIIDDEAKHDDKEMEMMDKSSDDDIASPVLSTDSDKEDKKSSGILTVTSHSSKQSAKSKKSRRKKK